MGSSGPGRVRVERGIYRQPNGKYAVCWRHAGRLRFRTVGFELTDARRERLALIAATCAGKVPVAPRLRFETVARRWLERFEAKVAAGERHPRTLEAHRYQLDRHLLPGLRISELLGLVWDDVDFAAGVIHVRAQLSRAHHQAPARRVAPKTPASVRDVPLVAQLARLLRAHRHQSRFGRDEDWVFATARGTPYGHRNVSRRMLGHARITITLDIYTHLFEDARHAQDIRTRMAASPFAG